MNYVITLNVEFQGTPSDDLAERIIILTLQKGASVLESHGAVVTTIDVEAA